MAQTGMVAGLFDYYAALSRDYEFERFVDGVLKMRRVDFLKRVAPQWSDRIVSHSKSLAQQHGRNWEFVAGPVDKDAWAKKQLQQDLLIFGGGIEINRLVQVIGGPRPRR